MDINIDEVLAKVAEKNGVTVEEVKAEMQKSIHEAAQDPSSAFKENFGDKEPSIEDFLKKISKEVMKRVGN